MGFDIVGTLSKFAGGLAGGIGEGIGKIAGKAAEWVPGPQQYRRNKINDITKKMLDVQSVRPFNNHLYDKLRAERDKLEAESINSGT